MYLFVKGHEMENSYSGSQKQIHPIANIWNCYYEQIVMFTN